MNEEQKRKNILKLTKIGMLLASAFLISPFVFGILQGLAGLIGIGVTLGVTWALAPTVGAKLANWRIKQLKAEAAKNPIETMENTYAQRAQALEQAKDILERAIGATRTYKDEVDKFRKEQPENAAKFEEIYKNMVALVDAKKRKYKEAHTALDQFYKEIGRQRSLWKITQAAIAVNKAVDGDDAEKKFLEQLQVDTAFTSIQDSMNTAFSDLETALLEDTKTPVKEISGVDQSKLVHEDFRKQSA